MGGMPPGMGGGPPPMMPPGMGGGGPPGMPPGGGAPGGGMMGALSQVLGRFLGQQNSMAEVGKMLDQMMVENGKLMQRSLSQDSELYQHLLRVQTALHAATNTVRKKSSSRPGGAGMGPIQSSVLGSMGGAPGMKPPQF